MIRLGSVIACSGALWLGAQSAHAGMIFGLPVTMSENNTSVTATFSGARAAWTGMLYLDDPSPSLGTFLFNNKSAVIGDTKSLGVFTAGATLAFNYKLVTGMPGVLSSIGDTWHFALEQLNATTVILKIEDMPISMSDRDWDDCVVTLRFSKPVTIGPPNNGGEGNPPIPTPGVLAVSTFGLYGLSGRRRRG